MRTQFLQIALVASAWAIPAPFPPKPVPTLSTRGLDIPTQISERPLLRKLAEDFNRQLWAASQAPVAIKAIIDAIIPSKNPENIQEALEKIKGIYTANPGSFLEASLDLILTGLAPKELIWNLNSIPQSSVVNINLRSPFPLIYPRSHRDDVRYSVPESSLRAAIHIPKEFTYGKIHPVIFVPGTASRAGGAFTSNFGKLFKGSSYADPVYLNIPLMNLGDIQVNAEYTAYAIQYISSITGHKKVSLVTWSQGSLDVQWALQYWPSTRKLVEDFIPISGDLRGTLDAYLVCPTFPRVPCDPAIHQQAANSTFLATLRNGGGDSAYVPTTSIYSIWDAIVQPQAGTGASAFFRDERGVGVLNAEIQSICPTGTPGGGYFTHEGVLYSPLAFELAKDALTHPGPANLERLDLDRICMQFVAEGLGLADVLATTAVLPVAAVAIVGFPVKLWEELPIMRYARNDMPPGN